MRIPDSRSQLIADIMEAFEEDYEIFLQTHDLKRLRDSYAKLLVNRDREVCVLDPKGEFRGTHGESTTRASFS